MSKQKKRRLADYSTSEMVKLCGMKASSTFENKRDKVFERYEIDPTLFKMDSSIEGGENFYPVVCAELLAILIKNWDKNPSSEYYGSNVPLFRRNGYRQSGTMIP